MIANRRAELAGIVAGELDDSKDDSELGTWSVKKNSPEDEGLNISERRWWYTEIKPRDT